MYTGDAFTPKASTVSISKPHINVEKASLTAIVMEVK
jgi:hypothetical protein